MGMHEHRSETHSSGSKPLILALSALLGLGIAVIIYLTFDSPKPGVREEVDSSKTPKTKPRVKLATTMGDIVVELDADKAPETVANFLRYTRDGHYDGTIFHRVIPSFMIQGGGLTPDMKEKPTRGGIRNEANNGLKNVRGTIAMARTGDPHSATSQFFISVKDNVSLDHTAPDDAGWGYCVFGKVIEGMDTVDKIKGVPTDFVGHHGDVPLTPIFIKSAKVQ